MVYPASFHKLVLIGKIYGEITNTTLSIVHETGAAVDLPAVSSGLLTGVAAAVGAWWALPATGSPHSVGLLFNCKLTDIKLNRIAADGRYQDAGTMLHTYGSPIAGSGSAANVPPQLTMAATLRGTAPRARAGKGRMYWPPTDTVSPVGADGRLSVADALKVAEGTRDLLRAINTAYATAGVDGVAGIASKQSTGFFQVVQTVTTGRVVDTMRSRRNKLLEDPQSAAM